MGTRGSGLGTRGTEREAEIQDPRSEIRGSSSEFRAPRSCIPHQFIIRVNVPMCQCSKIIINYQLSIINYTPSSYNKLANYTLSSYIC